MRIKLFNVAATALVLVFGSQSNLLSQTILYKSVLTGSYNSHENNNYTTVDGGAPTDWATFVAGQSGFGAFQYENGMGWVPDAATHTALDNSSDLMLFLRNAVNNNFDLVYMYASGENDPDYVDYAAHHGCAVITKYGDANALQYLDYRTRAGLPIRGMGPTPAMTVSCGSLTATAPENQYGPQLEFIDNYSQQSYIFGFTAAKYAVLKSAHPTWNVFDLRQALRQTCTHYAAGWTEEIGYGFPQVITRNGNGGSTTQPTLPTDANDLDAGPPIQPYAQWTTGNSQVVFTWYNFQQTAFASTVIKANGNVIYDGDGTSFIWTPNITGNIVIQFFTKLEDGRLSRSEIYSTIALSPFTVNTYRATPTDINLFGNNSSAHIFSIMPLPANVGTVSINSDGQTIHFVPTEAFIGTASFTGIITDGTYTYEATVILNVQPKAGNQPPVISTIANQTLVEGTTVNLPFTVSDDFTSPANLVQTFSSSTINVYCNIIGTGARRSLQITANAPVNNAAITLKYADEDGGISTSAINVTVTPDPNLPALSGATYYSSSGNFSFNIAGVANATWGVYTSTDLKNWTAVGSVTLDGSGAGSYTDSGLAGLMYKFYKLSDGTYTSRAIGFESIAMPAMSTNLVANQLITAPDNTLGSVFAQSSLPAGTQVQKYNANNSPVAPYVWNGTSWSGSGTLSLGEAALLENTGNTAFTVNFVGLVWDGQLMRQIPTGANAVGSAVPISGGLAEVLGLVNVYNPALQQGPLDGGYVNIWTGHSYQQVEFDSNPADFPAGGFTGYTDLNGNGVPEPQITVGQGVLYENDGYPASMTQTYSDTSGN